MPALVRGDRHPLGILLRHGGDVAVITTPAMVYASLEGTVSELEGRPGSRFVRVRPVTGPAEG